MGLGVVTRLRYNARRLRTPRNVTFDLTAAFTREMHFSGKGRIIIGARTRNRGSVLIESIQKGSIIEIGTNSFFNQNGIIVCRNKITIGNDCMFGPNVCIYDHDHLFTEQRVYPYDYVDGEVNIGNNVWCGANVIILRGSKIGDGAVIGAGCVIKGGYLHILLCILPTGWSIVL